MTEFDTGARRDTGGKAMRELGYEPIEDGGSNDDTN